MLHYTISGSGPALVFLHGFLENKTMWDVIINSLESEYTCIAIDLPGHGLSEDCTKGESITSIGSKVLDVLHHESVLDYKLIGHSMGGYVAAAIAKKKQAICLINSHLDADSDEKKVNRLKSQYVIEKKYPYFVKEAVPNLFYRPDKDMYSEDIAGLTASALKHSGINMMITNNAMMERTETITRLNRLNCHVTFIIGTKDNLISQDQYQRQFSHLNNCTVISLHNCGHMAHIEASEMTTEIIKDFVS